MKRKESGTTGLSVSDAELPMNRLVILAITERNGEALSKRDWVSIVHSLAKLYISVRTLVGIDGYFALLLDIVDLLVRGRVGVLAA